MQDTIRVCSEKESMIDTELIKLVRLAEKLDQDGYCEDSDYVLTETIRLAANVGSLIAEGVEDAVPSIWQKAKGLFSGPESLLGENMIKKISPAKTFATQEGGAVLNSAVNDIKNANPNDLLNFVQKYVPSQATAVSKLAQDSEIINQEILKGGAPGFGSPMSERWGEYLQKIGKTDLFEDATSYQTWLKNQQTPIMNELQQIKNNIVTTQSNAIQKYVLDSNGNSMVFQNQYRPNWQGAANSGALSFLGYNQIKNQFNQPKAPGATATTSTTPTAQTLDPNYKYFAPHPEFSN